MNTLEINLLVENYKIEVRNSLVESAPDLNYEIVLKRAESAADNFRKGLLKGLFISGCKIEEI